MESSHEIKNAVGRMDADELHALAAIVRTRLKFLHQVHDLDSLQRFQMFDHVAFEHHGKQITGVVIRINRRTAAVRASDGVEWKVSPSFLSKVREGDGAKNDRRPARESDAAGVLLHMDADGVHATPLPRNAPCFCGSGRKYKNCHGARG